MNQPHLDTWWPDVTLGTVIPRVSELLACEAGHRLVVADWLEDWDSLTLLREGQGVCKRNLERVLLLDALKWCPNRPLFLGARRPLSSI